MYTVCLLVLAGSVQAQAPDRAFIRGISIQAYPAGFIGNGHFAYLFNERQAVALYLGYNLTDRRDWGRNDDEEGGGAGLGVGWRYYFQENVRRPVTGWFLGARTDLWFLNIDWRDDTIGVTGTTDIIVLQPTAQVGYAFFPTQSRWAFDVTASLGAEINLKTDGVPVGEGAILLLGFSTGYRF